MQSVLSLPAIRAIPDDLDAAIAAALDAKTKPPGSLGRVEWLAARLARIQRSLRPDISGVALILAAGDHGLARAGVSAYPPDVTRQMLANILAGGAASAVLARTLGVRVVAVDAGVEGEPIQHPDLLSRRAGSGTANSLDGPAMDRAALADCLREGAALASDCVEPVLALGEMGIGNSSAAVLVAGKILGLDPSDLAGPGTGLDAQGLQAKRAVLARAAARTEAVLSPDEALRQYGGFEIALLAGVVLGGAASGKVVLVDGLIATSAALAACRLAPEAADYLIFAHHSREPGHAAMLQALGATPLLDLDLALGEGTGALLAWPLVRAAGAILRDMASFAEAGVSGRAS